jgi:dihydrolipoamide dehydrogenase
VDKYTVAIIGGGPGGYVAAIRLNQYGIDAIVFEQERLGGVCLNCGCIPTKTLVKIAELYKECTHAEDFGISIKNLSIDFKSVFNRKEEVVNKLVSGVEFIFQKRKIPIFNEQVTDIYKSDDNYRIVSNQREIKAKYVVVATGSVPKELPDIRFDHSFILSSKDILKLDTLPRNLVVIGGGVIGCEFASIFSQLGVPVDIVEFLPTLVSTEDIEISRRLTMGLKKQGINVHLQTAVESYTKERDKILLNLSGGKQIETDLVLMSVGRKPFCDINFHDVNLEWENQAIKVDRHFKTNLPNVFAIGDVTGKMLLAHVASKQGIITAGEIAKTEKNISIDSNELIYKNVPRCTFTNPEIGSVGLTESQAREKYGEIKVGKFPFTANGKALSLGNTFGFVKTIATSDTNRLVGMHIIGPQATELIATGAALLGQDITLEKLEKIVYAHPTLSEAVGESIEDIKGRAIHKM